MSGFQLVTQDQAIQPRDLFIILFGQPGVSKTSTSFTMPGPCLHNDFDFGIDRAAQKIRPDYFNVTDYGQYHNYIMSPDFENFVKEGGYKSIIIDTIGTFLDDHVAPYLIRQNPKMGNAIGGLTLQGWGALSIHFNAYKNRLKSLGLHICAIAHEKETGDGDNRHLDLAIKGGSSDIVYRSCDMLGHMSIRGQKRVLDFNPTQLHVGKNVAGLPILTIPDINTPAYDTFLSDQVIDITIKKMTEKSQAQVDALQAIQEYKDWIEQCDNEKAFEEVIAKLKEEKKALQTQVRVFLGNRMKEKGFKFDRENNCVAKIKDDAQEEN